VTRLANICSWLPVLLSFVIGAVSLTGCVKRVDDSVSAQVERLEKRVEQLERHECGGGHD
jgi:outer membrane murein-binding lipoprotein Lpp